MAIGYTSFAAWSQNGDRWWRRFSLCCIISRGSVGCAVVLDLGLVAEATTTRDACCTFELTPK